MTRLQPEREARDLLARYYVSRPPVPVEDLSKWMGARIARAANTTGTEVGFLLCDGTLAGASSREVLLRRLAGEFDVSTEAVTWRLLNLGVLT